ncbi:uncharacterized protein DUF4091 [Pontibacter ummariensis]|uniref:Uncharacterized protein n=1 Tax=Pontibacter ummariensis TaxID=1610492 RepID=A0A239LWF2_9BACT|nr:DUF4091 domain-containing protein [Pontibacter ummariensis]PRY01036.1 uncharacterized protein DUF4091 [Pontibacter ummariensis]SNT34039.1 protein of unknown function [Pontibacter ummariensis]
MRKLLRGSAILFLVLIVVPLRAQHYKFNDWATLLNPAVNVSFASSNTRFAQDQVPQVPRLSKWAAVAWKGEKVHTQLLVWANREIPQLRISLSDLKDGKGNRIEATNIRAGFVRYVLTDEFGKGCGHRKAVDYDSSWVADPIDTGSFTSVAANKVQPVWLSVAVPRSIQASTYRGTVIVKADKTYKLPITVKVQERELPLPSQWAFDLDLWQHPAAIARVHQVPLWSQEHYALMRPYYTMLAAAGQKSITASIIDEPWNHQTYDNFPSLIKWTRKKDGTWAYDYSIFDNYISFVMSCGIRERINCYTMVPWRMAFTYFDEGTGREAVLKAKAGTPAYSAFWGCFLRDFANHLKEKGWFSITSIAMDERPLPDMQAVINLLKDSDPHWKIALAGIYHPEIEKDIFDYSIASKWKFDDLVLQRRNASGMSSTFYTSCEEAHPNGFTFSPPAEQTWIGWYAAAQGFTGYLRWAYNSWVENPLRDSRFRTWPAGDTYQVYPGPLTSVRFEKLVEGIQDYEKVRLLREEFSRTGNQSKLKELESILSPFELQVLANTPAETMVRTAKEAMLQL